MHDKPFTAALYLLVGVLIAFTPICAQVFRPPFTFKFSAPLKTWLVGCCGGLLLGLTLPWWQTSDHPFTLLEGLLYGAIVVLCLAGLGREWAAAEPGKMGGRARWGLLAGAALIGVLVCFCTGPLSVIDLKLTAWHHWGAFIAPAEMMQAGARIFVDFPAQYGLGPTALIAAVGGANCWLGMYFVAALTTFGLTLCCLLLARAFGLRTLAGLCVVLMVLLAVTLFWNAYPPLVSSPTTTPSVSGIRFLPPIALAAVLWWSESSPRLARWWHWAGFALFAVGALWSPESLFMSLAVWGPYYCLRQLAKEPARPRLRVLIVALVQLVVGVAVIGLGFLLIYRLTLGTLPKLHAYLIYMMYPPGPMPINWRGPIWFVLGAIGLGGWAVWQVHSRQGNSATFRRVLMLILMSYASLAYAMGRSHDNNFLNLLPYTALILAGILPLRLSRLADGLIGGMLASLLGLLVLFGWGPWATTIKTGAVLQMNPRQFVQSLSYTQPATRDQLVTWSSPVAEDPVALGQALNALHARSKDPVMVISPWFSMQPGEPVWNTMHNPAIYNYIPEANRSWFLENGAKRLHRSGWILVHKSQVVPWLDNFRSAYSATEDLDFGSYRAVHFVPKP